MSRILLIEDEVAIRRVLKKILLEENPNNRPDWSVRPRTGNLVASIAETSLNSDLQCCSCGEGTRLNRAQKDTSSNVDQEI